MKELLLILFAVIFCYFGGLYIFQDKLIFYPHKYHQTAESSKLTQFEEVYIDGKDKTKIRLWYAAGEDAGQSIKKNRQYCIFTETHIKTLFLLRILSPSLITETRW